MIIIAKIDGWEKRIEVDPYIMKRGSIEIAFKSPMSILVYDETMIKATFYFHNYNDVGIPVFTFEG